MLSECIEVFCKEPEETRKKRILDGYIPANGSYMLVKPKDNSFEIDEIVDIYMDTKNKVLQGKTNNKFNHICFYDYNSQIISINKSIEKKKLVQSNNYLCFFIKKDSLTNGKLTKDIIDNYYDILSNPREKYNSAKGKELYDFAEKEIGKVNIDRLESIRNWIKDNIFNLPKEVIEGKGYLKIFFEYPNEDYINEGKRYLIPNIFNKNDFTELVDDTIYGLPDNNISMNDKKPYVGNNTRINRAPYLVEINNVIKQKEFFDLLNNFVSDGKLNVYISDNDIKAYDDGKFPDKDFNGIFIRLNKGTEVEIQDYDIITGFKRKLPKKIIFKPTLEIDLNYKIKIPNFYGTIDSREKFQNILNEVLFSKSLVNNYFRETKDINIKDNILKENLLLSRECIFNYIYKGIDTGIFDVLDNVSLNLIKNNIKNNNDLIAKHQFNLRWSLKNYTGGINMADVLSETIMSLEEKINMNEYKPIENDDEYYFSVGQIVSYLLTKYKGKNRPLSLAGPFTNAKDNVTLKENLRKMYNKYSYAVNIGDKRFKNYYVLVTGYVPEKEVNQDMIIAGLLSKNLIFKSNKEEVVNE